jgi:hypothetical protein
MKILILTLLMVSTCFICGCANWDIHRKAQNEAYLNRSVDELNKEYGKPIKSFDNQDGSKLVVFEYYRAGFRCGATATVDINGVVTDLKVGGQNGCIISRY